MKKALDIGCMKALKIGDELNLKTFHALVERMAVQQAEHERENGTWLNTALIVIAFYQVL